MKTYSILSAIFLVSVLTSCENDIPLSIKENSPKLVINAMIDIDSEENHIYISKTGRNSVDSINDAQINIYINGELKEQLTEPLQPDLSINYRDSIFYHQYYYHNPYNKRYKTDLRFYPGDKVKIEVFADNNKYHAWAEDIIPKPLEIESIDTVSYRKEYSTYIRLRTTFTDFPNEKNFYRLALSKKDALQIKRLKDGVESHHVYEYEVATFMDTYQDFVLNDGRIFNEDDIFPLVENRHAIFDDTRLNTTYSMITSFYRPENYHHDIGNYNFVERVSIDFKVHLISITEMQYYYLKALNTIMSGSYDEYISMPVSYPSNVEGGIGIVGFSAGTYKTFNIPDFIPDTTRWHGYE